MIGELYDGGLLQTCGEPVMKKNWKINRIELLKRTELLDGSDQFFMSQFNAV